MNHIIQFLSGILVFLLMNSAGEQVYDDNLTNTSVLNESLLITDSSLILEILLTNSTPLSSTFENNFTTSYLSSSSSPPITTEKIESINSLIDQINSYRNIQINSRIKHCDTNMKLNDLCEIYSINGPTNTLIRQTNIEFSSFDDLFDNLVNRIFVQNLNKFCLSTNQCLENLTDNDIQYTKEIIQKRGKSFCSLEQCHSRLLLFIESCPTLSNTNITTPTLKLVPMLCTLYNEQESWNSIDCIEKIAYLLHIFYAFWPQIEACYENISTGFDSCTSECQTFDEILNLVENQCDNNASFLSRVPALAWYQAIDLKEICHQKNISRRPQFIYSVQNFFSSNKFWYHLYEKPLYTSLFIIIVIFFVISISLCVRMKSKNGPNSNNRRFDNNYEYARLNNTSFELGTNTEIPNTSSTANEMIDEESQFDSNGRFRSSEYQRLLFVNS